MKIYKTVGVSLLTSRVMGILDHACTIVTLETSEEDNSIAVVKHDFENLSKE